MIEIEKFSNSKNFSKHRIILLLDTKAQPIIELLNLASVIYKDIYLKVFW